MSKQVNLSRAAEQAAIKLLNQKGFRIIESQPAKEYSVMVNDDQIPVRIIADFLVSKEDYVFVAEVKNGLYNTDISNIQTRRQLLEYYMAYGVDGLLLVDMVNKKINLVQFSFGDED